MKQNNKQYKQSTHKSNMYKLMLLFFVSLLSFLSVNAATLEFDVGGNDNTVLTSYTNKVEQLQTSYAVNSNDNTKNVGNSSFFFDLEIQFYNVQDSIYLIYDNTIVNHSIAIGIFTGETFLTEGTFITQELTLDELGRYYFKVNPSFRGEDFQVLFNTSDNLVTPLYVEPNFESEESSIYGSLINSASDLITINLTIIRTLFYMFIFGVVIIFVSGLFWGGFKLLETTKRINNKESIFESVNNANRKDRNDTERKV